MCSDDQYELIFSDGTAWPQRRFRPCRNGSATSPCADYRVVEVPAQFARSSRAAMQMQPRYVEARPVRTTTTTTTSTNTAGAGAQPLRRRRGTNDIRLEFDIPWFGRRGSSSSHRRDASGGSSSSVHRRSTSGGGSGGGGFGPVATTSATYSLGGQPQYVVYDPGRFASTWEQWTPPPRIITVDPARPTPPATPSTPLRRSHSVEINIAGREHTLGHTRQRSASSTRPAAPPARGASTGRRSPASASLDGERARQVRALTERIERLARERERTRRARVRDAERRVRELTARIEELRRQRRAGMPGIEVHQAPVETTLPLRPHPLGSRRHHRAAEDLDDRGRRVLAEDANRARRSSSPPPPERRRSRRLAGQQPETLGQRGQRNLAQEGAHVIHQQQRQQRSTQPPQQQPSTQQRSSRRQTLTNGEGHVTIAEVTGESRNRPRTHHRRRRRTRDNDSEEDIVYEDEPRARRGRHQ